MNWNIIKQFSSKSKFGFRKQDVIREYPEKHPAYLSSVLAKMVEEGMLGKLSRDHFHIIPVNKEPETYVPDRQQIAKYIMQDKVYYIGYASAMRIHKLALQLKLNAANDHKTKLNEYVVTKNQVKPAVRIILGITYQFIRQDTTRFYGFSSIWINQLEQAMVSDLEKTIVDMTAKPHYCGGIVEVANALLQSKYRTDHDKLFYYFARYKNKSAKKRFLFLSDLLGLEWKVEHERMMGELGPGTPLLDPAAPDRGSRSKKFGLRINVDPIHIKKNVLHQFYS